MDSALPSRSTLTVLGERSHLRLGRSLEKALFLANATPSTLEIRTMLCGVGHAPFLGAKPDN